jgi:hypothetical protein
MANMWLEWGDKECIHNFGRGTLETSAWKIKKEIGR